MFGFYSFLFFSQVLFWSKASTPPCRLTLLIFNYTSLGVCQSLHPQHNQHTFWEVVCAIPKPFSSTVWMELLFWGIEDSIAQYSLLSTPLSLCCPIPYSQISSSYCSMCTKVALVQNNESLYPYLLSNNNFSVCCKGGDVFGFFFLKDFFPHNDRSVELCNLEGWNIYQSGTEHYFYYVY